VQWPLTQCAIRPDRYMKNGMITSPPHRKRTWDLLGLKHEQRHYRLCLGDVVYERSCETADFMGHLMLVARSNRNDVASQQSAIIYLQSRPNKISHRPQQRPNLTTGGNVSAA
jgi:hypothetical protein